MGELNQVTKQWRLFHLTALARVLNRINSNDVIIKTRMQSKAHHAAIFFKVSYCA